MTKDKCQAALLAAVDEGFDAQLALTAELVRFPSTRLEGHQRSELPARHDQFC